MSRIRDRLAVVGRIITNVVPQVRSGGTYTAHSASMPACWEMETGEGIFLLTEGVLLLPDDPALSTLLDIWAIGGKKILSVHWMEKRPWQPPHITCFKPNELRKTLRTDGWLFVKASAG